jgi:hypothetical protein
MSHTPRENEFERQILPLLTKFTGKPARKVTSRRPASPFDLVIQAGDHKFFVDAKRLGTVAAVAPMLEQNKQRLSRQSKHDVPLLVVPFMGETGIRLCEEAGVSWLDLSGNARISAKGLYVYVDGRPNQFLRPGRPASVFAPKSSRVARKLLMAPEQRFTQRELAEATSLDEGFISKIVGNLEASALVIRDGDGRVHVRDPKVLLDAWHEAYDFSKHHVLPGHIPARSGDALLYQIADQLTKSKVAHAVTGLAGAWLHTRFAAFRVVTVYVAHRTDPEVLAGLGFHAGSKGENVWLVHPNDEGVLTGADEHEGVRCVHPVQVYLDLKGHSERAREAAQELREKCLTF